MYFLLNKNAPTETQTGDKNNISSAKLEKIDVHKKIKNINSKNILTHLANEAVPIKNNAAKDSQTDCWTIIASRYKADAQFKYKENNKPRIDNIVGDWFYKPAKEFKDNMSERSASGKFFLALAKANLLSGFETKTNLQKQAEALQLLNEVSSLDTNNSAPLLFAAIIKQQQGLSEEADDLLQQANSKSKFNSYMKDVVRSLYGSANTVEELLSAIGLYSSVPIPNYSLLNSFLLETHNIIIAQQLVADGINENSKIPDVDWLSVEYAIGNSILEKLGANKNLATYKELYEEKRLLLVSNQSDRLPDGSCNLQALENQLQFYKEHLK